MMLFWLFIYWEQLTGFSIRYCVERSRYVAVRLR